jgi:uncharacterized membrane protein/VanZ family protein
MVNLNKFHLFAALTCAYAAFLFYLSSLSALPGPAEFGFLYGLVDALKNAGLEVLVYPFYLAYLYPDKVAHVLLYLVLGLLLHFLFRSSAYRTLSTRPALFAVFFGVLFGVTDELHQYFVPYRSASALDLAADLTGLLIAQLLIFLYAGVRNFLKTEHKLQFSYDLLMVLLFDFFAYLFVLIPPFNQTPLRVVFALPLLLFLPGYVLIAAMFPRKVELSSIERFTLSIGLSIAIFVFDGFAISVTPWRFRPAPIVYSLSLITVTLTAITLLVRAGIPAQDRYSFDLSALARFRESLRTDEKPSDIERALIIALVGSIIIASGMLIYAKVTFNEEKFTAFYILGEGGKAENYPKEVHLLEPSSIIVGIENYEHAPVNYTLQVQLGGYPLHEEQISLAHNGKWEDVVQFTPRHVAKHAKLEFLLYKDGSTSPYRSVHLWVDSVINYANLAPLRSHALTELPVIANPDMELDSNWTYTENAGHFRGHYTKFYRMAENATVSGYVTDNSTGMVIGNARVYVTNRYGYEKTNITDESGYYELHLIPDYFWLATTAMDYRAAEAEFDLAGGEPQMVNLGLDLLLVHNRTIEELSQLNETIPLLPPESLPEEVSTVNGYVYDTVTGLPVVNASVIVRNEYGFVQTTRTNEQGYYEVNIITGRATVEVHAAEYALNTTSVVIASAHTVDLQLTPANSVIQGYVYDTVSGSPVANAYIWVSSAGYSNATWSNATGYYAVRAVADQEVKVGMSKGGYFSTSTNVTLAYGEVRTLDLPLEPVPPLSSVKGYVVCQNERVPWVNVVISDHDRYERSTLTDSTGYFELETIPGHLWLDVLPSVYGGGVMDFVLGRNQTVALTLELNSFPNSTYQIEYPSGAPLQKGQYGEIYQEFISPEGVATLSFKVSDSYRGNSSTGYLFKQVLLNDLILWEDDVEGDEGWQEVRVPITPHNGTNRLTLRVYAMAETSYFPLTVWWDDVRIEPFEDLTKELTTSFSILDVNGSPSNYPTTLYLGETAEVRARIENNEQRPTTYILQVRLDGAVLRSEEVFVEDGAQWEQPIAFTPDQLGALLKLEFLLFKDRVTERPYKSFTLWVSSEVDYTHLAVLKDYVIAPLPAILNGDMEESDGWSYTETDANYSGVITNVTSISPYHAYELSYPPAAPCAPAGSYAMLSQNFIVQSYPAAVVLSLNVKDSYTGAREGFLKQVLLNDVVVWQDDVAGDERWQHLTLPVPLCAGTNTLALRLYSTSTNCNFPISVWWDDVKIEAITAVSEKLPTMFAILDSKGTEEHYPTALYLGEPVELIATIENNEHAQVTYELQVKLDGRVIRTKSKVLDHGSHWEEAISFASDRLGAAQRLEFLLFKNYVEERPYRYFALPVSTELNYLNLEPLLGYGLEPLPAVKNGEMSSPSGWTFESRGSFQSAPYAHETTSSPYSYGIKHSGGVTSGDYGELWQNVSAEHDGVAVLSFNVRDTDELTSDQGKKIINQVLVNDEVVWSDDISGDDTGYVGWVEEEFVGPYWIWNKYIKTREAFKEWVGPSEWWEDEWIETKVPPVESGWRRVDVPVYLYQGTNTLSLQVTATERVGDLTVMVYWDDVKLKPINELVKIDERSRMRRYGW